MDGVRGKRKDAGGRRVTLLFRLPFRTVWGENLVLVADEERLGGWEVGRGAPLACHHVGDELVWQALLTVSGLTSFRYRYVLVDEQVRRVRPAARCTLRTPVWGS